MFDNDLQFYPTPPGLAARAWSKFKNREFVRILEPSAGKGDLALAYPDAYRRDAAKKIDCLEINYELHGVLKERNLSVIGTDFLEYDGPGAIYSHIIMNPPFQNGDAHVLKAWSILYNGEIVAILNAETIRNPYSRQRQLLASLIERFGEVEYIEGAFKDAERTTNVEVALVYLRKTADLDMDIIGNMEELLSKDRTTKDDLSAGISRPNDLALPESFIENTVRAFNAAVEATKAEMFAKAKSRYYTGLLGKTLAERNRMEDENPKAQRAAFGPIADNLYVGIQNELYERYKELKDRAWTGILRSSQVLDLLSSKAQKRVESSFEDICKWEFTTKNVYAFLQGLVGSQADIQIGMICDVFDEITRYHSDNVVYFMGWKSNDKHRVGMKVRTSRFILPGHGNNGWRSSPSWETSQLLRDFDKVFALLDGKVKPEVSLEQIFQDHYRDLTNGKRISSSYLDVRYYPTRGTIHFFPRDKRLITRLNLLVGRHRQWLPAENERVSKEFWLQYEKSEKIDKEIRAAVDEKRRARYGWRNLFYDLLSRDDEYRDLANEEIGSAIAEVLTKHGIDPVRMLEAPDEPATQAALPLLKAAG